MKYFDRFVYFLNSVFALLLILSYLLPYIPADFIPLLSILNFSIPILLLINLLFAIYWFIKLNKRMMLSIIILGIGYPHITSLYVINEKLERKNAKLHLLSYNVRHLNMHQWINDENISEKIDRFLLDKNPSVIALQDFKEISEFDLNKQYPYNYIQHRGKNKNNALAIYSKFPILNQVNLNFENSLNNAIYTDLLVEDDTLRVYNIHLESLKITPSMTALSEEDQQRLIKRVSNSFALQAKQAQLISESLSKCKYSKIVMGDFNNTAFSSVYREIKSYGLKDSFKERGNGFGRTFDFDFIPIRIDFILTDEEFEVIDFSNYNNEYSDHYPISSWVNF